MSKRWQASPGASVCRNCRLHDLHRLSVPKFEKGVNGVVLVPLSQRLFGAAEAIPSVV